MTDYNSPAREALAEKMAEAQAAVYRPILPEQARILWNNMNHPQEVQMLLRFAGVPTFPLGAGRVSEPSEYRARTQIAQLLRDMGDGIDPKGALQHQYRTQVTKEMEDGLREYVSKLFLPEGVSVTGAVDEILYLLNLDKAR